MVEVNNIDEEDEDVVIEVYIPILFYKDLLSM